MKKRIGREQPYGHENRVNSRGGREFTQGPVNSRRGWKSRAGLGMYRTFTGYEFVQCVKRVTRGWEFTGVLGNVQNALAIVQHVKHGGCEVSLCVLGV